MNKPLLGVLRHILTFGGGYLVSDGVVNEGEAEALVGAVVTLVGVLWSVWEKRRAR